jgi:8-oxo-dGTP diphosphatase
VKYSYKYPRPALAVDAVVFGIHANSRLHVLLIERGEAPFLGSWALPGGFVLHDEDLSTAVRRELLEETGINPVALWQLGAFGDPLRDPRGRVVSVAWTALVRVSEHSAHASTDAVAAQWFNVEALPELAFDHAQILGLARRRLAEQITRSPVVSALLPEEFTLTQWQMVQESVLGRTLDKRNFRKWAKSRSWASGTGRLQTGVAHRAAQLYRFVRTDQTDAESPLFSPDARHHRNQMPRG